MKRLRRKLGVTDFERMNLPHEFWRAVVQVVPESMRDIVTRYLVNTDAMVKRGAGMMLSGDPGVGKTGIAALVLKEARSRGYTAYFTSVWELRECVKTRIDFEDGKSVPHRCREVDVLVLDGLDEGDKKDFHFDARDIEHLIKYRGARRKVTVVTTRMSPTELASSMSGLMIAAQGCMVPLRVIGEDLRQSRSEELNRVVFGQD